MTEKDVFLNLFALKSYQPEMVTKENAWKVLIVDDDDDIHSALRLTLLDQLVEGRKLQLFDANSAEQALVLLDKHPDMALILLDVVMETELAGLELVRHIRDDRDNRIIQILLITGQPGYAPERKVVTDYQIDGYRLKSELTSDRIYVSVCSALRTYRVLNELQCQRSQLSQQNEVLARWEYIFEHAGWGTYIQNINGEYVELCNPAFAKLHGYTVAEILGLSPSQLIAPEQQATWQAYLQKQHSAVYFSCESIHLNKNGVKFPVQTDISVIKDAEGQPLFRVVNVQDITDRKLAEEKLRLSERIFQTTSEGIMITDTDRNIVDVNAAFSRITGYARAEVLGKNPRILQSGQHEAAFYAEMWDQISKTDHFTGEIWNRRKKGEIFAEYITISALRDEQGKLTHYVGILTDITAQKQHEIELERIAHYDVLTGIPNRMLLIDRMRQAMAQTCRHQKILAVCYLDLDGFKSINDVLGHAAGDKVLIETAKRINNSLRASDTVARLGGDEFVILLLGLDDLRECNTSLDRLLSVIARPIALDDEQLYTVTASIGATLFPSDNQDSDTLLRHADQAMYQAKQLGKNRYYIFDPNQEMQTKIYYDELLRIKQGFQNNEFELFYQPKVELCSYKVIGVEALIRWRHPERGILSPDQFLTTIENSPLENLCGEWVIKTALTQLEQWLKEGLTLQVSVNISVNHLQSPLFVLTLQQVLAQHPAVPAERLQIEILETAALVDIPKAAKIITECAEFGVSFALDDFGTGYSSLSYLRRLPAETLKIDLSFVRDMLIDKDDRAIVNGIISLGHTFNRNTVAEGVETQAHFELLRDLGCDMGQGFGIAKPMPAAEIRAWCAAYADRTKP